MPGDVEKMAAAGRSCSSAVSKSWPTYCVGIVAGGRKEDRGVPVPAAGRFAATRVPAPFGLSRDSR
jgi:hypothetical protein